MEIPVNMYKLSQISAVILTKQRSFPRLQLFFSVLFKIFFVFLCVVCFRRDPQQRHELWKEYGRLILSVASVLSLFKNTFHGLYVCVCFVSREGNAETIKWVTRLVVLTLHSSLRCLNLFLCGVLRSTVAVKRFSIGNVKAVDANCHVLGLSVNGAKLHGILPLL